MRYIFRLNLFVAPYLKRGISALVLLTTLVALDLAIPRLIPRIIDQGIHRQDQQVVIWTGILMLGISFVSLGIAVGNNILSVQVGEGVGRDLREAIFLKIQTFSFANLDGMKTGQLLVRLSSDTSAVQRLVQVSLRIGTRAPLLMIGSFGQGQCQLLAIARVILANPSWYSDIGRGYQQCRQSYRNSYPEGTVTSDEKANLFCCCSSPEHNSRC